MHRRKGAGNEGEEQEGREGHHQVALRTVG